MPAKLVTEFVGTFFLVLLIGLTVSQGPELAKLAPLAIGGGLIALVYMGAHISGAHYNPAVTLAFLICRNTTIREAIAYWLTQFAAAVTAALLVSLIIPGTESGAHFLQMVPGEGYTVWSSGPWLVELLFSFLLVLVILHCANSTGISGNSFYGIAIGMTVMAGAYACGDISGGVFNPAVGVGPNLVKGTLGGQADALAALPLYIVGPISGAALATMLFNLQESSLVTDNDESTED